MCGIVGVVTRLGSRSPDTLLRMRDSMSHRGPDHAGVWWSDDRRVGLAHRRLSIIDLSPAGRQPMADARGDLWITFNGEIYNYRALRSELEGLGHPFHTTSDTEVLITAYRRWRIDCLRRLNGMFAFGLYDARVRKLVLAWERAGEKPRFYRTSGAGLAFASELKALMADPSLTRAVDPTALKQYLAYGYVAGEACLLAGVRKLPAAHVAAYHVDT